MCQEKECTKRPYFNVQGETKALYCATHKKEGMMDVVNKTCIECTKRPVFNIEGQTIGLYCVTHKKNGMINIVSKTCKTTLCDIHVSDKYNGYCLNCFIHLFPDEPNSHNYKTKEKATSEYILEQFPIDKYTWVIDKKIQDGCSRKRPDLLLDLGYQVIIVEVDENQHTDYDCSCENKRIMELSQDLGYRPIVFIRFNPDDYEKNGINITSCWGQNKKGICVVKKSKKDEWIERLDVLEQHIKYWINPENTTNKTQSKIFLLFTLLS